MPWLIQALWLVLSVFTATPTTTVHRYQEAADKLLLKALNTESNVPAIVLRIRTNLCHCYSKVCHINLVIT